MNRLELMMKEYETLRQESLNSMSNRSQIISFGLATIGLVFAAVFALDKSAQSKSLMILIFSVGIPIISILILYIWLGEVERMMRASQYLCELEARINAMFKDDAPPLQWEGWLRNDAKQMLYPYIIVIVLFLGFAFFSPVVGFLVSSLNLKTDWWAIIAPWLGTLYIVLHVLSRTRKFE